MGFWDSATKAVSSGFKELADKTGDVVQATAQGVKQANILAQDALAVKSCDETYSTETLASLAPEDFYTEATTSSVPNPAAANPLHPTVALQTGHFGDFYGWLATKGLPLAPAAAEKIRICLDPQKGFFIPSWLQSAFHLFAQEKLGPAQGGIASDGLRGFIDKFWEISHPNFFVEHIEKYNAPLPTSDLEALLETKPREYLRAPVALSDKEIQYLRVIMGDSVSEETSFFKIGAPNTQGLREVAVNSHLDPKRYDAWVKFLAYVLKHDQGQLNPAEKERVGFLLSQFGGPAALSKQFIAEAELSAYLQKDAEGTRKWLSWRDRYALKFYEGNENYPEIPLPLGTEVTALEYFDPHPPAPLTKGEEETFALLGSVRLFPSDLEILAGKEKNNWFRRVLPPQGVLTERGRNTPQYYAVRKDIASLVASKITQLKTECAKDGAEACSVAYKKQLDRLEAAFSGVQYLPEESKWWYVIFISLIAGGFVRPPFAWVGDVFRRSSSGSSNTTGDSQRVALRRTQDASYDLLAKIGMVALTAYLALRGGGGSASAQAARVSAQLEAGGLSALFAPAPPRKFSYTEDAI